MADLKEEANVENTENVENTSSVDENVEETVEESAPKAIDPSLEGIQLFYEQNKKMVTYVGGGLIAIVAAFVFYKFFYLADKEKEVSNEIYYAQAFFERDSFNLALKGGPMMNSPEGPKAMMGFEQIADEYGVTNTGNLANYYAGICLLRTGKFEQAIERLQQYSGSDPIIAPIAIGATGDANLELNKTDEAIKYYLKAAESANNSFITPFYLKKAGFAYELKSNFDQALEVYERIKREYPKSAEGKEIEREIAKVTTLANK